MSFTDNNEYNKYVTRVDFFGKVIQSSPDPIRTLVETAHNVISPDELSQSASRLNISQDEFKRTLFQRLFG